MSRTWTAPLAGVDCFGAVGLMRPYVRHSHEGFAIGVFEAGVGATEYRGAKWRFPPGHIVAMNPDQAHTGFGEGGCALTYRMFYVSEAFFNGALHERTRSPYFRDVCIRDAWWAEQLMRLHASIERSAEDFDVESRAFEVLGGFAVAHGGSQAPAAGREPDAVTLIKQFLRGHYQRNVTIRDLAALTGLSPAYVIRAFRRAAGMPPHTWLLQVRIDRARRLLAQGHTPADVACAVGFADQSHLTRRFRRVTGLTPGQYATGHYRSSRRT